MIDCNGTEPLKFFVVWYSFENLKSWMTIAVIKAASRAALAKNSKPHSDSVSPTFSGEANSTLDRLDQ